MVKDWDFGIGKKSFRTPTGNTNARENWILRLFLWPLFCFDNINELTTF